MGHNCTFLRKTFHVLRLAAEERLRDEERKICIHMSCFLEHLVEHLVHLLPDSITVRLDHHTASYCRALCKIRLHNKVVIPLRIIIRPFGHFFCHDIYVFILIIRIFVNLPGTCVSKLGDVRHWAHTLQHPTTREDTKLL